MKLKFLVPTFLHLLVDFFSILGLYTYATDEQTSMISILIYTAIAFILQPVIGMIIDYSKNPKLWMSVSCFITLLGFITFNAYSHAIIAGLGNALFHVSGGKVILDKAKKSSPLGVFIGAGAIGVALASLKYDFIIDIVSIVFAILIIFLALVNLKINYETEFEFDRDYKGDYKTLILPLLLVSLGVLIRGFSGKYTVYTWSFKDSILYISLVACLGKSLGGFIKDKFNDLTLLKISLVLTIVSLFFQNNFYLSLVGILGTNLLMALTLDYVRKAMPKYRAFGFGILAALLAIGTYLGGYLALNGYYSLWANLAILLINFLTLLISYISLKRKERL